MKLKQSKDYTVYSRINSEGKNAYEIVAETPRGLADGKRYVQSSVPKSMELYSTGLTCSLVEL